MKYFLMDRFFVILSVKHQMRGNKKIFCHKFSKKKSFYRQRVNKILQLNQMKYKKLYNWKKESLSLLKSLIVVSLNNHLICKNILEVSQSTEWTCLIKIFLKTPWTYFYAFSSSSYLYIKTMVCKDLKYSKNKIIWRHDSLLYLHMLNVKIVSV